MRRSDDRVKPLEPSGYPDESPGPDRSSVREHAIARWGPIVVVTIAVAFGAIALRGETRAVYNLNDGAVHIEMIEWANEQVDGGRVPLDGWFPNLGAGFPQFHHYQSFPHIMGGYLARWWDARTVYAYALYLLLALWPVCIYKSARIFGWDGWVAAGAALICPLLASEAARGYEYGSYLWRGSGLWAQAWAMWALPLSMALGWRAISKGRGYATAALATGATIVTHLITGYLALLWQGAWLLVAPRRVVERGRRVLLVAAGSLAVAAWLLVPLVLDRDWVTRSIYNEGTEISDSFGAKRVLGWLISGELFDSGRAPIVTLLVAAGALIALRNARRSERDRALLIAAAVSLVLFFGRSTLGPLLDGLPGSGDLLLRRFIVGVHLTGILLAGIAVGAALRWIVNATVTATDGSGNYVRPALALVALSLALVVPFRERAAFASQGGRWIDLQSISDSLDGADVRQLMERAREEGGGRVYAGLRSRWGDDYRIGFAPVYTILAQENVDAIGFTLRTRSLSSDVETLFDETDPSDYDLFNVRYLLLPFTRDPPVPATPIASSGRHRLYRVESFGYVRLIDTAGSIPADRTNLARRVGPFLNSDLAARGIHPVVALDGLSAPRSTLETAAPASPPGIVASETDRPAEGTFVARVRVDRTAAAMLKTSFHGRWSATVDGRDAPVYMVAPSFVATTVGTGDHVVEFRYRPWTVYPLLIALGIAAVAMLAVAGRPKGARITPTAATSDIR